MNQRLVTRLPGREAMPAQGDAHHLKAAGLVPVGILLVLALAPLLFREVIVYKAGVVLIFFVAAIGLHLLVNWAGQLSLAHSSMVGLSAFGVLAISEGNGISPIYLLPVAAAIGGLVGAIVALPTLRAKGLQVALVTLVAGIAINRFFFTQSWLVGPAGGRVASTPTLGPLQFTTARSLYPVLVGVVAATVVAAFVLMHSKVARAWFWVQADANAAAAFGIRVVAYRIGAYSLGGAFGGLAGGLTVMWVQRLGQDAFPSTLSFSYLLIAVLAGPGFLGGLALATWVLQGGQQFASNIFGTDVGKTVDTVLTYAGVLAVIDIIARYPAGLNGFGRRIMKRLRDTKLLELRSRDAWTRHDTVSVVLIAGAVAIVAGFVAIALAWRDISQTDQLWIQNQELISGGLGGLGLILLGVGLLIRDRLTSIQTLLARQLESAKDMASGSALAPDSTQASQRANPPVIDEPTAPPAKKKKVSARKVRSRRARSPE